MAWRDLRIVCAGWVLAVASAHAAVGITPPNLSGATAGSLPGAVSVSPKGSAGYSIPLAVPPGTAGMAPAVALEYDSQAGMDMLGLGWKIAGQSTITRCGKTRAVDGVARGVTLDAQDPFCLDGQRLLLVSGTHGANAWYRTEIDGIARVRSYGTDAAKGPDSWTVELKDGRKQSYGTNAGSLFIAPGKTARLSWAISRAEDRYGNYISYQYVDGEATGEFYLTKIRYTGNDAASPALVPYNAINFIYEDRPDDWSGYVMGSKLQRLKRLTNVQVRINTAADGSGGTFKRELRIAYNTSAASDRSMVSGISDCVAGGACLPATSFEYSTRNLAHNTFNAAGSGQWVGGPTGIEIDEPYFTHGTPSQQLQKAVLQGDVDGDGKSDLLHSTGNGTWLVCKSTGASFSCSNWVGPAVAPEYTISGDFNRDGRTDLVVVPTTIGVATWTMCLSTGSSFNCSPTTARSYSRTYFNSHRVADYTGDGRDDLLVVGNDGVVPPQTTWLCPSNGAGFDACVDYTQNHAFTIEFQDPDYKQRIFPLQADFNGDGRMDVFKFSTLTDEWGSYEVFLAGDSGFTNVGYTGYTIPYAPSPRGVADFNQDGYPDVINGRSVYAPPNGVAYKVETCPFTGVAIPCTREDVTSGDHGYATAGAAGLWDGTDVPTRSAGTYVNGVPHPGIAKVLPSGLHRDFVEWTAAPTAPAGNGGLQPADFDGDGLLDAIHFDESTQKWFVYLAGRGSHPDLLSKVTTGYGHVTQVVHKGLYDATVYSRGADVAWPKRNQVTGAPVVSLVRVAAASGEAANQWIDTSYTYSGLRSDMEGRGSLGFEKVNAIAETVNAAGQPTTITTTTTYSQNFPTTGMPLSVVTKHSDGTVLSQTTNTLASFETTAGAQYPYVRLSTVTRKDLNGSALPTIVTRVGTSGSTTDGIDIYGNVTKLQETITDGSDIFATVTDSIYSNNATTWLLGLRTDMTVKKSAPGVSDVTRTLKSVFNGSGRLTSDTLEPNNTALKLETVYGIHSVYGVTTTKTLNWHDPQANAAKSRIVETLLYDAKHRYPETVKNAKNQQEERTYDEATGNLLTLKGPNLLTTEWAYDPWGRKTREDRPDGTATTWAYKTCVNTCGYGNTAVAVTIEQQWAVIGGVDEQTVVPKETFFDALGRQVFVRSWDYQAGWLAADNVYDALGRLRKSSSPHTWADRAANRVGWTLYTRDDLGRPTKVETTNQTGTGYDATDIIYAGQSTTTTNAKSQDRTEVVNGLGKLKRATDANGKATSYVYDPWGNLKTTTDPLSNQIKVNYDTLGRKTQLADPDLGTWNYKVNPLGQTYEQTDAKLQKTTFTFDELGRLTDRVEVDQQSHWVYDTASKGIGKLAEAYTGPSTAKDYQRIHSYDTLGRTAKVITRLIWSRLSI
jgi:YD repeat-containing protein